MEMAALQGAAIFVSEFERNTMHEPKRIPGLRAALAALGLTALAACATVPREAAAPNAAETIQILALNDFPGNIETPASPATWFDSG